MLLVEDRNLAFKGKTTQEILLKLTNITQALKSLYSLEEKTYALCGGIHNMLNSVIFTTPLGIKAMKVFSLDPIVEN